MPLPNAAPLLNGKLFHEQGIHAYIKDDFFAWLARPDAQPLGADFATRLSSLLHAYDLSRLNEDVLKSLYQELVDPDTRHDLGEYYTHDWYRPLFLRERFDALMGNPPWIAFRFLEGRYQAFLRPLIVGGYGLSRGRGEMSVRAMRTSVRAA